MRERRLLERLRLLEENPELARRGHIDERLAINGVIAHLEKLLNTRQGNVQIAPDYGIPDFGELLHTYPESIKEMERALKQAIRKYEPRLKSVRVKFVPNEDNPLDLSFEIKARLALDDDAAPVFIESIVDSDGKITIR